MKKFSDLTAGDLVHFISFKQMVLTIRVVKDVEYTEKNILISFKDGTGIFVEKECEYFTSTDLGMQAYSNLDSFLMALKGVQLLYGLRIDFVTSLLHKYNIE